MISEFTQYDIGEEELDDMIDSLDEESRLYYKLKDIRLLYDGFQDYLKERYITKEELLDVLSREVRESELLKNSGTGWIYRLYTGAEQADSGAYEIL